MLQLIYRTAVPTLTAERTRAKKVLALFQEGAYRQLVDG
jgi:hypothetical protein